MGSKTFHECFPTVKNVLLLDGKGKRIAAKYYSSDDWPTKASKLAFEKLVFTKTEKMNARAEVGIGIYDGYIVVYKFVDDLHFYVTGGEDSNELILAEVLDCFVKAISSINGEQSDQSMLTLGNTGKVFQCLDAIVDKGIILETDPDAVVSKVVIDGFDETDAEKDLIQGFAAAFQQVHNFLVNE